MAKGACINEGRLLGGRTPAARFDGFIVAGRRKPVKKFPSLKKTAGKGRKSPKKPPPPGPCPYRVGTGAKDREATP